MELIIAELSRYIIVILFALYTFYSYRAFIGRAAGNNEGVFRAQRVLIVMLHLVCSAVILVEEKEIKYVVLWALELFFFLFFTKIYQVFYKGMSKLIWNNMMICMMIGFIMLGRLSYDYAIRQLVMASLALGVCLLVPLFIERFTIWEKIGWQYALAGVLLLLLVFVIGVEKYGARNWISIGGFELQPSEFVKIIYVFFIASLLAKRTDFKSVAVISIAAAVHVGILVLEKDLGAALIYFVTYLMMLYVATMKLRYLAAGAFAGTAASVVAYQLFAHVRVRVQTWLHPFADFYGKGNQIGNSLFGIGTGGWFGQGLYKGQPSKTPEVIMDCIFTAVCEELGGIIGICLILICIACLLMFIAVAAELYLPFYKLIGIGLTAIYGTQVFLTIGGGIKFIPLTGVTLPLVSYGGSSMFSTVLMLSIIQGLYILREDEGEELEKRRNKKKRNQQKNDPGAKKKRRPDEETERRKKSGGRNDGQGTRQKYREQPDEFERRIEEQTENSLHW